MNSVDLLIWRRSTLGPSKEGMLALKSPSPFQAFYCTTTLHSDTISTTEYTPGKQNKYVSSKHPHVQPHMCHAFKKTHTQLAPLREFPAHCCAPRFRVTPPINQQGKRPTSITVGAQDKHLRVSLRSLLSLWGHQGSRQVTSCSIITGLVHSQW